jgi:hypothetical protein
VLGSRKFEIQGTLGLTIGTKREHYPELRDQDSRCQSILRACQRRNRTGLDAAADGAIAACGGDAGGKRLELLCAMVPSAHVVGLLVNPRFGTELVEQHRQAVAAAAKALGRELVVQKAATDAEIDAGFAELVKAGIAGLVVQNDPFFDSRRSQILALSSRHRLPGIFHIREYPSDGGLMSYGASLSDTYRQLGVYTGKIFARCQAGRSSRATAYSVRASDQYADRKDDGTRRAAIHSRCGRRIHRVRWHDFRFWHQTDMLGQADNVCS